MLWASATAKALAKLAADELLGLTDKFGPFALLGFSVGATASQIPSNAAVFGSLLSPRDRMSVLSRHA